jgi:hypothetical protein
VEEAPVNRQKLQWIAIPVVVVLCIASWKWPQVQGIATILLLLVTFEYVLLTQENIGLFRRQLARQEKVYMDFELVCRNGPLLVRVANLGVSNFLLTAIHVRTQDKAMFDYSAHEVVQAGKIQEINLPREACADHPLSVDLEITLEYLGLDVPGKSEPKCFNVGMALDNIPNQVKKGLDGLWTVACPRCGLGGLIAMSLRGLNTFEETFARKRQILEDLRNSCPNHASKWLLSMDDVEHR